MHTRDRLFSRRVAPHAPRLCDETPFRRVCFSSITGSLRTALYPTAGGGIVCVATTVTVTMLSGTLDIEFPPETRARLRPFRGSTILFRFYGALEARARAVSLSLSDIPSGERTNGVPVFPSRIEVFTSRGLIIRGTAAGARISGYNLARRVFQLRAAGLISHLRA